MAAEVVYNQGNRDEEHNQFICPIVYTNEMPTPPKDCKYLPCGQIIREYGKEPVLIHKLETRFSQLFKGLHELFKIDLMDQKAYDELPGNVQPMDPRDAALLKDIEALDCGYPRRSHIQECGQMFAKERVQPPRPRTRLQRSVAMLRAPSNLEPISLELQKAMIDGSFRDIKKPLLRHPTKPGSNARPVMTLPVFPDTDLQDYRFVQMKFDIPPHDNNQNLIKDCGSCLINFRYIQDIAETMEKVYLSDHRYREEKAGDNLERSERFILREEDGVIYYVSVDKYISLRRERPRPQASANKCLLQVTRVEMETM
ncbi:uncharacterized protein LOC6526502 isoform X1 [Drosophila yakuba]|uniref:RNA polymerase II-associated factor 1 homolog n=1 Tax=Drosophila yakuba TaxID=7245 RepID=A0A0R1DIQ3_DROYA|nr:uncharacterized protein LOC6526502 isoform X1 [Drosophila yakuba]KRJ97115.1 uncharacterized protein Dyak_GE17932, isoform B [Drosophila yakuba]